MDDAATGGLKVQTVGVEQVLARGCAVVVDLRSPSEFAEDSLPGAHSVPLLGDLERSIVGTLYSRVSPGAAYAQGLRAVEGRMRALVEELGALVEWRGDRERVLERLAEVTRGGLDEFKARIDCTRVHSVPERALVVHCWRGGMRSQSVAAFLGVLGFDRVYAIEGGYKSYRQHVMRALEVPIEAPAFVLRGLTGVGKTLILRELEALEPGWAMDLELAAGHRSSLLGMVGLEPVSQKQFESRLAQRAGELVGTAVVFEGESRKVGDAVIPGAVWSCLRAGVDLRIEASMERRVQVLREDYMADEHALPLLRTQLAIVDKRLERDEPLVGLFDQGRIDELVRVLLEEYYDPLYRHSEGTRQFAARFESTDAKQTAREVRDWIRDVPLRGLQAEPLRAIR